MDLDTPKSTARYKWGRCVGMLECERKGKERNGNDVFMFFVYPRIVLSVPVLRIGPRVAYFNILKGDNYVKIKTIFFTVYDE